LLGNGLRALLVVGVGLLGVCGLLLLSGVGTCWHILALRLPERRRVHSDLDIAHIAKKAIEALIHLLGGRSTHQARKYVADVAKRIRWKLLSLLLLRLWIVLWSGLLRLRLLRVLLGRLRACNQMDSET